MLFSSSHVGAEQTQQTEATEQRARMHRAARVNGRLPSPMQLPPCRPQAVPSLPSLFPSFPLSGELPMMLKLIFLRGMIKMDAHDLPLAIPAFNFIRNEI
jgi:hypothetical protein